MLVIRVELHSAITGKTTEIGRMVICNDGSGTPRRGNYSVALMRRGSATRVQRRGVVRDFPRKAYSVWGLVQRALETTLTRKKRDTSGSKL